LLPQFFADVDHNMRVDAGRNVRGPVLPILAFLDDAKQFV